VNFRLKNFLVSVLFPLLYILFIKVATLEDFTLYGTIFIGMIIEYFLLFWLLNFDVHPQGFLTILLLPVLFFASFMITFVNFVENEHLSWIFQVLIVFIFLVMHYYLTTTQSILNISLFRTISLSQAAFTTNNFYTIITFFTSVIALFLPLTLANPLRVILTIIPFAVILGIYVILNNIEHLQYFFALFFYTIFTIIIAMVYMLGVIHPEKFFIIAIVLGLTFRGIVILIQYMSRKVISIFDYIQLFIEVVIVGVVIWFTTF
jgi:hypothetical protein